MVSQSFRISTICCLLAAIIVGCWSLDAPTAPYIVEIYSDSAGFLLCGGALIGPKHVLTAATCTADYKMNALSVVAGVTGNSKDGIKRRVTHIFTTTDNPETSYEKDVAVLELASPIEGQNVEIISMASVAPKEGNDVEFPAWIANYDGPVMVTTPKRIVKMPIVSREECKKRYGQFLEAVTDTMLCAFDAKHEEEDCFSPSGSPVIYNGQVAGVISWGETCGYGVYPVVMANVAALHQFVYNAMKM